MGSVVLALALRAALLVGALAVLAIAGLLVLHKAPVHWWMPTVKDEKLPIQGHYSPLHHVPSLLSRAPVSSATCNVILSQHSHTRHSDGSMTVQQVLDWHAAQGFTAVAVTDHNTLKGGIEAVEKARGGPIVAIAGMEWSHCRGHYNFLFPSAVAAALTLDRSRGWVLPDGALANVTLAAPSSGSQGARFRRRSSAAFHSWLGPVAYSILPVADELLGKTSDNETVHAHHRHLRHGQAGKRVGGLIIPFEKYPSDRHIKETFGAVHSVGGIVVVNHLPWSSRNFEAGQLPSRQDLIDWHADYVEIASEATLDAKSLRDVREGHVGAIAGTDVHFPTQHAYGWTCLNATDPTDENSIFDALRKPSSANVLFDAEGTPDVIAQEKGDRTSKWPSVGHFFGPLLWVGVFFERFLGSSVEGGHEFAFSFVDGYCGQAPSYRLRWGCIFAGLFWLAALVCFCYCLLIANAKFWGRSAFHALGEEPSNVAQQRPSRIMTGAMGRLS